jgi:lactoylglutathione lyase
LNPEDDDEEHGALVGRNLCVSLSVSDIDKTYTTLCDCGVEFLSPPNKQPWGGTLAHFKDPEGNLLTLLGS